MDLATDLVRLWESEGVRLNKGASRFDLDALGQLLGIDPPDELRTLYCLMDGMTDLEYDVRQVSLWSIAKIKTYAAESPSPFPAFADFLIESWYFRFGVGPNGLVVLTDNVVPGAPFEEIGSFSAFLNAYIFAPRSLYIFEPTIS